MSELQAPTGYRFKPSDVVLIQHYFIPKIEGRPLPSEHIFETELIYGKESPDLEFTFGQGKEWYKQFASYDENFDDSLYFFTKLTKKWENGKRISRSAGRGTWTGDKGKVIYTDQTYTVKKSYFTYTDNAAKSKGPKSKGHKRKMTTLTSEGNTVTWNMYEYSILKGEQTLDYAIVKIKRKRSKKECSSSTSSKQSSSCNNFGVHDAVPEVPASEVGHSQYQLPIGQSYVNTNYHTGAAGFQHLQGSGISSGNVVPVLPAAEYNHLQHQPSTSSTELDATGFPGFSFSWFLQDTVLQPQQNSYGDSLYDKHLLPSVYQHKTVVPPLITDDQQEKDLDFDSRATGGDNNAAAWDRNQECTSDILMTHSEVEAVQQQKEPWTLSDEELSSNIEFIMESELFDI